MFWAKNINKFIIKKYDLKSDKDESFIVLRYQLRALKDIFPAQSGSPCLGWWVPPALTPSSFHHL